MRYHTTSYIYTFYNYFQYCDGRNYYNCYIHKFYNYYSHDYYSSMARLNRGSHTSAIKTIILVSRSPICFIMVLMHVFPVLITYRQLSSGSVTGRQRLPPFSFVSSDYAHRITICDLVWGLPRHTFLGRLLGLGSTCWHHNRRDYHLETDNRTTYIHSIDSHQTIDTITTSTSTTFRAIYATTPSTSISFWHDSTQHTFLYTHFPLGTTVLAS